MSVFLSAVAPPVSLAPEALAAWPAHLAEVAMRPRAVFRFRRTHHRAVVCIEGLMSTALRKSSWPRCRGRSTPTASSTWRAVLSRNRGGRPSAFGNSDGSMMVVKRKETDGSPYL